MKIVGPTLLGRLRGPYHQYPPSLSARVSRSPWYPRCLEAGVSQSGVTVHWVDSGIDTGKIIQQVRVPRLPDDCLESFEARIHEAEYVLYPIGGAERVGSE